jgi:hypothetical protein
MNVYRRRPGGELGGLRAPTFPVPWRLHHRRLGRSERTGTNENDFGG